MLGLMAAIFGITHLILFNLVNSRDSKVVCLLIVVCALQWFIADLISLDEAYDYRISIGFICILVAVLMHTPIIIERLKNTPHTILVSIAIVITSLVMIGMLTNNTYYAHTIAGLLIYHSVLNIRRKLK